MVVGVVAVGALAFQVTNDLTNSSNFRSVRSLQYAAKSTTNLAIQNIRYTPLLSTTQTLNASPPTPCWLPTTLDATSGQQESQLASIDGEPAMASWCSTAWTPSSASTRVVTISTCPGTVGAAQCAAHPLLQAVVTFDDYPNGSVSAPASSLPTFQCQVYCGTSMLTNSWVWSPTVPTVTAMSPTTGATTGGTAITITGTGFLSGATVQFVEVPGAAPSSTNNVITVSPANVTVNSPTSISAVAPSVIDLAAYHVTVTTLKGTSAYSANDVFTYTPVAPTVTSIGPTGGGVAGGTSVTIVGSGFQSNAIVQFAQETNGTLGGATLNGRYVNVLSSTSMTVVSPGVTTGSTYYVRVVETGEPTSPTSATDVFTYSPLVPTVSAVSPVPDPMPAGRRS